MTRSLLGFPVYESPYMPRDQVYVMQLDKGRPKEIWVLDAWWTFTFRPFVAEQKRVAQDNLRRLVTDAEARLFGASA